MSNTLWGIDSTMFICKFILKSDFSSISLRFFSGIQNAETDGNASANQDYIIMADSDLTTAPLINWFSLRDWLVYYHQFQRFV